MCVVAPDHRPQLRPTPGVRGPRWFRQPRDGALDPASVLRQFPPPGQCRLDGAQLLIENETVPSPEGSHLARRQRWNATPRHGARDRALRPVGPPRGLAVDLATHATDHLEVPHVSEATEDDLHRARIPEAHHRPGPLPRIGRRARGSWASPSLLADRHWNRWSLFSHHEGCAPPACYMVYVPGGPRSHSSHTRLWRTLDWLSGL